MNQITEEMSDRDVLSLLYLKGVRAIKMTYDGGDDSGGIGDTFVYPDTLAVGEEIKDWIYTTGNSLLEENGIGFTGDGHYSGATGIIFIKILDKTGRNEVTTNGQYNYYTECDCSPDDIKEAWKERYSEQQQDDEPYCEVEHGMYEEEHSYDDKL